MDTTSLMNQRFPRKEVIELAKLIEIPLRYYRMHNSPLEKDHFKYLKTVVGLGFTAILADGDLLSLYENHLYAFSRHRHFKMTKEETITVAFSAAHLISGACQVFKYLGYPSYYEPFKFAFLKIANHLSIHVEVKIEEVEQLLKIFLK